MAVTWAQQQGDDVVVALVVQPRASKNTLCGVQGDELKVRLSSPPVDGAANKLCQQFIAKTLGCAKSRVRLVSGHKSRHKRLVIEAMALDDVVAALST